MTARTLTSLLGNTQRLDGGAMFGNAPKALWTRWATPDDRNRIPLACRSLLITEPDGTRILCETGVGACFPPKLADRYGVVEPGHRLLADLAALGLSDADIDVVVLSHLHFDHAGGLLTPWAEDTAPALLFPRATYVVGRRAWERARHPHPRDRASFLPELVDLLQDSGRLALVDDALPSVLPDDLSFHTSEGHTPGLLLLEIPMPGGPVVFAGDLVPGVPWVRAAITMGYDRFPERLIDEKTALLADLVDRDGRLFFTHDPDVALARLVRDARGRVTVADPLPHLAGQSA